MTSFNYLGRQLPETFEYNLIHRLSQEDIALNGIYYLILELNKKDTYVAEAVVKHQPTQPNIPYVFATSDQALRHGFMANITKYGAIEPLLPTFADSQITDAYVIPHDGELDVELQKIVDGGLKLVPSLAA